MCTPIYLSASPSLQPPGSYSFVLHVAAYQTRLFANRVVGHKLGTSQWAGENLHSYAVLHKTGQVGGGQDVGLRILL